MQEGKHPRLLVLEVAKLAAHGMSAFALVTQGERHDH
jgi:hypothetical protein